MSEKMPSWNANRRKCGTKPGMAFQNGRGARERQEWVRTILLASEGQLMWHLASSFFRTGQMEGHALRDRLGAGVQLSNPWAKPAGAHHAPAPIRPRVSRHGGDDKQPCTKRPCSHSRPSTPPGPAAGAQIPPCRFSPKGDVLSALWRIAVARGRTRGLPLLRKET